MRYELKNGQSFVGERITPQLLELMRSTIQKELVDEFDVTILDHLETVVAQNLYDPRSIDCYVTPKDKIGSAVIFYLLEKSIDKSI